MSTASGRPSLPSESAPPRACDVLEQLRAAYGADAERLLPTWMARAESADPAAAHAIEEAITDAATELAAELTERMRGRIETLLSALSMSGADLRQYVVLIVDHRSPEAPEEFLEVHPPLSVLHIDDLADELAVDASSVVAALEDGAARDITVVTVTFARLVVDGFTFAPAGSA